MSREEICTLPNEACILFGLRWSTKGPKDIDAACGAYDGHGHIVDVAYYNNLYALKSIIHSGDCTEARDGKKDDESISIHFETLPPHVVSLMISVHCYTSGSFADCESVTSRIVDFKTQNILDKHTADYTRGETSLLMYQFRRSPDGKAWTVFRWSMPLAGRTFMDSISQLLPLVRPEGSTKSPPIPKFNMHKGDEFVVPGNLSRLSMGLGWDTKCDLDASAILLRRDCTLLETVYFSSKRSQCGGVVHSGDNLTGEGGGDDEVITLDLEKISKEVFAVVFTVNVFTARKSFSDVKGEYCRLVDISSKQELFRYNTLDSGSHNGVLFCAMYRDVSKPGWWKAEALGEWGYGSMAKDLVVLARATAAHFPGAQPIPSSDLAKLPKRVEVVANKTSPSALLPFGIFILIIVMAVWWGGATDPTAKPQGRKRR